MVRPPEDCESEITIHISRARAPLSTDVPLGGAPGAPSS